MMQAMKGVRYLQTRTVTQAVSELSVPVPWGEIRGRVWGPDHGRPVLCLHGWADNCGTFNTLIPFLPKEYRYVAVDLAGHGQSSHRPPGVFYAFPSYVMDVRRVVDALQWSKFSIIGHSMGGNIAGMFSALYPEMVDSIVLLDSYGFLPSDQKEIPEVMRKGMDEMLQYEKKTEEDKRRVYTYEKAAERAEAGFDKLYLKATNQKTAISALLQAYRDRNHTVVKIPGDHHVHLNNPEAVAPLVSDFLQTKVLSQSDAEPDEQSSKL
ncbi:serine hydrolase-like protein isoform X2 [Labrus bergylta]|uniref:serine hydrolase-like protein isoform X2 n=1 Tax=Labrus bergylta TaxID=56723 RepID=UPI0033137122